MKAIGNFLKLMPVLLALTLAGVLAWVIFFGGEISSFLTVAIISLAAYVVLLILLSLISKSGFKRLFILLIIGIILCVAAVVAENLNRTRENSIGVVDDSLALGDYLPFSSGGKVAVLENPAFLTFAFLTDDMIPSIDGTEELYPLYSSIVRAIYPADSYEYDNPLSKVRCSGYDEAYNRLISGEVDMIFAPAPTEDITMLANINSILLELTPVCEDALVFITSSENPVSDISSDDLRAIYSGQIANWENVGGQSLAIKAFQRPEGSLSQKAAAEFLGSLAEPLMAQGSIAPYKNYKESLGYMLLFNYNQSQPVNSKLLSLDGIAPTPENIENGSYLTTIPYYIVTVQEKNPNVGLLTDWLFSNQGRSLIVKAGYQPAE